jgi:hypothetical protein
VNVHGALAHPRGQARGVTGADAGRLAAAEDPFENLGADQAGGRGDDDHEDLHEDSSFLRIRLVQPIENLVPQRGSAARRFQLASRDVSRSNARFAA